MNFVQFEAKSYVLAYEFVVLLNLNQFCEMVIWRKKMVGWMAAGGQNKIMGYFLSV